MSALTGDTVTADKVGRLNRALLTLLALKAPPHRLVRSMGYLWSGFIFIRACDRLLNILLYPSSKPIYLNNVKCAQHRFPFGLYAGDVLNYFNWEANQPNSPSQTCIVKNSSKWMDRSCSEKFPFVCQVSK